MLLTDAFGGFGGIAKFNQDFLKALDASPLVGQVRVWPRLITEPIVDPMPTSVIYERGFAKGKLAYLWRFAAALVAGPSPDLVICAHINLLPLAWLFAKVRRAKLALITHGIDAWSPTRSNLTNMLTLQVDAVVAVSQFTANRFCVWSKVPHKRVYILPNAVDVDQFTPGPKSPDLLARYGLDGNKIIMTLGRLASKERYKGFDEVLDALPKLTVKLPNLKYLIVGDGPDADRLKLKANLLGVSDITVFAGRIDESEKVDHYRLADVYVMPSTGEGFGIVLIEAAACGIPIVGSAVDGSREALLNGELGTLVTPTDQAQLLKAVCDAFEQKGARIRPHKIEYFDRASFNSRVHTWIADLAHTT